MGKQGEAEFLFVSYKGFLAWGGPAAAAVNIKAMGLFFYLDQKEEILTVIHYIRERVSTKKRRGGRKKGGGGERERGIKKR